jgi:hypothetical protein
MTEIALLFPPSEVDEPQPQDLEWTYGTTERNSVKKTYFYGIFFTFFFPNLKLRNGGFFLRNATKNGIP